MIYMLNNSVIKILRKKLLIKTSNFFEKICFIKYSITYAFIYYKYIAFLLVFYYICTLYLLLYCVVPSNDYCSEFAISVDAKSTILFRGVS